MPVFKYNAINSAGTSISGVVEAENDGAVRQLISSKGLIPTKITKTRESGAGESINDRLATVKARELILFTKQFATMLKAGIPIVDLFSVIEQQTENPKLKKAMVGISRDIQEGASLHQAMSRHNKIFSPLYLSMMRAGETSGALPDVLERLIYIIEHEHKVKKDIKGALVYPAIVLTVLTGAFFFLITFVVPKFVTLFSKAELTLPLPTKMCMGLYQLLAGYWIHILITVVLTATAFVYYIRTDAGRHAYHRFLLAIPLFGPLFVKSAMSRFSSIFAILQASGVTVLDSFDILSETIGNAAMSRQFGDIRRNLEQGKGISGPLAQADYFTPMVVNMVAIGEESGNLEEMLWVISNHYDDEVEYAVKNLSEAIVPILTIGLAGVVLFFALAIFLPMWDMMKMVN